VQVAIGGWSLLLPLGCALGATLSSESSVGIAADYNSNPALLATGASAAESVAVVATLPATYSSDSESFDLVPQLRLAETHGDAQLLTDYQYLDADWHLASERNSFSASAGWHRDSTFYNVYENTALHGRTLPRLEDSASLAWQRELSESSNLQLQAAWNQVDFSARSSFRLDNESYEQASIQYFRALSEHWSSTSSIGWGLYRLRNLGSRDENRFLQSSLAWALAERWSLTAGVGYSLIDSSALGYLCCEIVETRGGLSLEYIPLEQRTSGGTLNYSVSVERRSERLVWDLVASRSIQPSSLGALLTQDNVSLRASLPWSERLTLGATLHGSRLGEPLQTGSNLSNGHYYDFDLYANWLCTEHWTAALQGSYNLGRANVQAPQGAGVSVALTLTRQFGRLRL
jgi:hypothetical protein